MARTVTPHKEVSDLSGLWISGVNAAQWRQGCLILPWKITHQSSGFFHSLPSPTIINFFLNLRSPLWRSVFPVTLILGFAYSEVDGIQWCQSRGWEFLQPCSQESCPQAIHSLNSLHIHWILHQESALLLGTPREEEGKSPRVSPYQGAPTVADLLPACGTEDSPPRKHMGWSPPREWRHCHAQKRL